MCSSAQIQKLFSKQKQKSEGPEVRKPKECSLLVCISCTHYVNSSLSNTRQERDRKSVV